MDIKGLKLSPEFEKAIMDLGFSEFTEIQEKCIPLIQSGADVIGLSYTGSGKTAAFGFPALEKVVPGKGIQLFVMVPTRELCLQVAKEFRKFTKYRKTNVVEVYGGVSINPQMHNLRQADVVVGTPGRILDVLCRTGLGHLGDVPEGHPVEAVVGPCRPGRSIWPGWWFGCLPCLPFTFQPFPYAPPFLKAW